MDKMSFSSGPPQLPRSPRVLKLNTRRTYSATTGARTARGSGPRSDLDTARTRGQLWGRSPPFRQPKGPSLAGVGAPPSERSLGGTEGSDSSGALSIEYPGSCGSHDICGRRRNVTAMSTDMECPLCERRSHGPGVRTDVTRYQRRGYRGPCRTAREMVCTDCAGTRDKGGNGKVRALLPSNWRDHFDLHTCSTCGIGVYLPRDARRKVAACSDRCRYRHYDAARTPVEKTVTNCSGCGGKMTGRSDRRYCSPACRQRAYRQRAV
jgi:hypothetical protein